MILNTKNARFSFSLPHSGCYRWMKFVRIVDIYILSINSWNISFNFSVKFLCQCYHLCAYDYIFWLYLFVWCSTSASYSFPCHSLQINASIIYCEMPLYTLYQPFNVLLFYFFLWWKNALVIYDLFPIATMIHYMHVFGDKVSRKMSL